MHYTDKFEMKIPVHVLYICNSINMGTSEPIRELKGGYWREETDVSIVPNLVGLNSNQVRTKSSRTWIQNRVHSSSTLIIFTFTKSLMLMSNSS